MKLVSAIILSLIFLILNSRLILGATYYVSQAGSDSNSGTGEATPWKTLNKVNSFSFQPGDRILFRKGDNWSGPGTSGSAAISISRSGNSSQPITYTSYGSGAKPIFRNLPLLSNNTRVVAVNASYVTVEDLYLADTHEAGIIIGDTFDARNVTLRNNEITNVGQGVLIKSNNNLISGNYIHDLHMVRNNSGGNDDYGATGIAFDSASNNEISGNRVIRAKAVSMDYGYDGGVVEWWRNSNNNLILRNWGQDSNGFMEAGGVSGDSATGNVVAYNVSVNNNLFSWIHIGGTFGITPGFVVDNNTIVETAPHNTMIWSLIGFNGSPTIENFKVRNNIFYVDDVANICASTSYNCSFGRTKNIYYLLDSRSQVGYSLGSGDMITNPQFVNPGGLNFQLSSGSPAINAAANLGYTRDYPGNTVPAGTAPDIGSHEFGAQQFTSTPTPSRTPSSTPVIRQGDANGDGRIDGLDYAIWLSHFGQNVSGSTNGDFNNSGRVDGIDFVIWLLNFTG